MPRLPRPALVLLLALAAPAFGQGPPASLPAPAPPPGAVHSYPPGVVDVTPEHWPARAEAPCTACRPEPLSPFLVSVDYLLARLRRRDLDFAVADANDDLTPEGRLASLDYSIRSGVRLAGVWRPGGGPTDLAFTYTYAYGRDTGSVTAPDGGLVYSTLTRPGRIDEVDQANASSSLNYNVIDLDYGRRFAVDDSFMARFFGGTRWAFIHQVLEAGYDGRDANNAFARQRVNMDGGGLTAGGEARWQIGGSLSAFGRGRGSLVVGDYRLSHRETDFGGELLVADVSDKFTKVVPVLDLGAGLSWRFRSVRASVGYELSHWFNQVEGMTFLDDFSEGKRARRVSDLTLEAVTFGLSWEF
jgi:hypothetical protein